MSGVSAFNRFSISSGFDVFPAGQNDHFILSTGDGYESITVDRSDITREKPAVTHYTGVAAGFF